MKTVKVAIVLVDKVLQVIQVSSVSRDEIADLAFAYADQVFGPNERYELALLDEPRTLMLFAKELQAYGLF
jgi:hypothetical protein